jgi:hypothetical protein
VSPAVPVVLAGHAAGFPPLLQEAGLVDDEDARDRVPEVVDDVRPEVVADAIGVPGRGAQQALHPAGAGLADRFRELPAVLALYGLKQARQGAPGPLPRFGAGEAVGDPRVQILPGVRAPLDRGQSDRARRCPHGPPRLRKGQRTAGLTQVSL